MARKWLAEGDAQGAAYVMRDTDVAEQLGLTELFTLMYQHGTVVEEVARYLEEVGIELDD